MSLNNLPQREEYLRKKRKRKIIRWSIAVFLIILIIGLLSYISYRPNFRISKVTLTGGVLVTEDDVEQKTLEFTTGSYFWLFPKNNAFLYRKGSLEQYLKETFKRIDTINIHLKDFHTLAVDIVERKLVAIWCANIPTAVEENCYFMDGNSTIFAPAPQFSGDAYFKYYGNISETNPIGKEYIASTTVFVLVSDFVNKVKDLSIHPVYIVSKENNEFSMTLLGGGQIYFDMKTSLTETVENLKALLRTPELKADSDGNLPVEYIDLRYGNKLFYKLKS